MRVGLRVVIYIRKPLSEYPEGKGEGVGGYNDNIFGWIVCYHISRYMGLYRHV